MESDELSALFGTLVLFYIFQCCQIFFTGADFYNMPYVIYKDLAIADVTGIEAFPGCFDDFFHRRKTSEAVICFIRIIPERTVFMR